MGTKGLRNGAIFTFFVSMGILLIGGHLAKDRIPPIPQKVARGETALTDRACGRSLKQYVALADRLADHFGVSKDCAARCVTWTATARIIRPVLQRGFQCNPVHKEAL
jgi:hypothetical protein